MLISSSAFQDYFCLAGCLTLPQQQLSTITDTFVECVVLLNMMRMTTEAQLLPLYKIFIFFSFSSLMTYNGTRKQTNEKRKSSHLIQARMQFQKYIIKQINKKQVSYPL